MKLAFRVVFSCLLSVLPSVYSRVRRETGCPPEKSILPCKCYDSFNQYLECINVNSVESLVHVFVNSARYSFNQVNISFSSLSYLPHEMFEQSVVQDLYLYNVTLGQVFESPPSTSNSVRKIHIENTMVQHRISWDFLKHLNNLKILNVYYNVVRVIGDLFLQHVTRNLEQLTFYATQTRTIKKGAFVEFINLSKIAIDECSIKTLSRDMFPPVFNVKQLYFNDNNIKSIPEDLFTDMPSLQTVGLRNNQLTTLPEEAFGGRYAQITYIMLDGNPLECNCMLVWMVKNKPESLQGSCNGDGNRESLKGRHLRDLKPSDFNC